MSSRYRPNEPTAPIAMELIALLLRSDDERIMSVAAEMMPLQRASVAMFCAGRGHLRRLGLLVARQCTEHALWEVAGRAGVALFEQARDPASLASSALRRAQVTLARSA